MPILGKVLPYLNAILMVLTEIINVIASLLGFDIKDYDFFGGVSDSAIDMEEHIGGAAKGVSKLKKEMSGLRSFDKLNNITTPKSSGAGAGAGAGGINPKIMDAFNKSFEEYNKKLTEVKMKATEIRDRIMEWLGFTKIIDKETGKVSFKFDHITKGLVILGTILSGSIFLIIKKIFKVLSKMGLINFSGISKFFKAFSSFTGISQLAEGFKVLISGAGTLGEVFSVYVLPILQKLGGVGLIIGGVVNIIKSIIGLLDKTKSKFDGITDAIKGVALVVAGVATLLGAWPVAIIAGIVAIGTTLTQFVVHHWDEIKKKIIDPITNFVTTIAQTVYNKAIKPIVDFFKPIIEAIKEVFGIVKEKFSEIYNGVKDAFSAIINKVSEIFKKIWEIINALSKVFYDYIIKPVTEFIGGIFQKFYDVVIKPIVNLFKSVGDWVYKHIAKPIIDKVIWIRDEAVKFLKSVGTIVVNFISNAFKSIINGVLGSIERKINSFINLLNKGIKVINKIPGVPNISYINKLHIPRLEKGMDFVPKDYYGPVYLDYGERVLTKDENKSYSGNNNGGAFKNSSNPLNATFIIKVGDEQVAKQVLKNLQETAKTNGKPITITG